VVAAAEPVPGPEIPAVDVGTLEESLSDEDEEAGAVEAAAPNPKIPDVMLSDVESELPVGLAAELDEVGAPPAKSVMPLPVVDAAEGGDVSEPVAVEEAVGNTITEGTDPEDAADPPRALARNEASGSLVLSLELESELELDVAADGATIVV
jgi:hypothetical protein